jgi:hypothetical protein
VSSWDLAIWDDPRSVKLAPVDRHLATPENEIDGAFGIIIIIKKNDQSD